MNTTRDSASHAGKFGRSVWTGRVWRRLSIFFYVVETEKIPPRMCMRDCLCTRWCGRRWYRTILIMFQTFFYQTSNHQITLHSQATPRNTVAPSVARSKAAMVPPEMIHQHHSLGYPGKTGTHRPFHKCV